MNEAELFNKLFNGGNYALPYLIKFTHGDTVIRLVNDNKSIQFNGETYNISSFEYNPPNAEGTGATLSIKADDDNGLMEFVENADDTYTLEVVGVLVEGNTVEELHIYKHMFGSVSCSEDKTLEFELGRDDRLDLQFCPYTFDTDNNRANA